MTEILLTGMQRMNKLIYNVLHSSTLQNIDNTFCIVWVLTLPGLQVATLQMTEQQAWSWSKLFGILLKIS